MSAENCCLFIFLFRVNSIHMLIAIRCLFLFFLIFILFWLWSILIDTIILLLQCVYFFPSSPLCAYSGTKLACFTAFSCSYDLEDDDIKL